MAHVLLPSDLPSWPDVAQMLGELNPCPDPGHMLNTMQRIAITCSVSLDPEEGEARAPAGLLGLCKYVEDVMGREERKRLLEVTLPALAARAADLPSLRPPHGLRYSLKKENGTFRLSRGFISSLLANAFFSTFPKRTSKTHPTLQDFRMGDFFAHLAKRRHQRKLIAFLDYFESLASEDPTGEIVFTRKVVSGPSLPGWLCSDRALVPLVLRPEDDEPHGHRTCFCTSLIGGDVIKACTSKEARLMFEFPELLVILCFVESLGEDETLVVEMSGTQVETGFYFLESSSADPLEDQSLLRELNKGLTAFLQQQESLNSSGLSSSQGSNAADDTRFSISLPEDTEESSLESSSNKMSLRTASQSQEEDFYTADDDSDGPSSRLSTSLPDVSRSDSAPPEPGMSRCDSLPEPSSRSDSAGFVLGGGSSAHERLDDFRRRIRKRTRRRRRRGSYGGGGSSGSSDMEDISEDPELDGGVGTAAGMRPANSEPSIANAAPCLAPVCDAVALQGRSLMVRASNGRLKAYSYDGVNPNLPVPFRARFRKKPSRESTRDSTPPSSTVRSVCVECGDCSQLTVALLWLAASMARLPALELFTDGQHHMQHVYAVYREVLRREWTVGDLSCEVLRFCRMRSKHQLLEQEQQQHPPQLLFQQLLGTSFCSSSRDDSMDSLD